MIDYDKNLFEIDDKYNILLAMSEQYAREYEERDDYYYDEDDDYEDERQTPEEYKQQLLGDLQPGQEFILVRYLGNDAEVRIPDGVHGLKAEAFSCNKTVRKVYVPDSVLRIADSAFSNCTALEEVRLSANLNAMGICVFLGCTSLKALEMPDTVTLAGGKMFKNCTSLTEVRLSENLSAVPVEMFNGCTALRSIKIPDKAEVIRVYAFDGCRSLKEVRFGRLSKLEAIGWDAFARCPSLKSMRLPDGLKDIDQAVFYDSGLEEIYFPQTAEFISPSVFTGCHNVKTVEVDPNNKRYFTRDNCIYYRRDGQLLTGRNDGTVPKSVKITNIGNNAYECNGMIEQFDVPKGVRDIGIAAFRECVNLRRVTFPSTLKTIGRCAFEETGLEEVIIPGSVKEVEENSFACSKLKRVVLKRGVQSIESYAFRKCTELREVYISASVKTVYAYSAFYDCDKSMRVYIEKGAKGEYIQELQEMFDVVTDYKSDIFI